MILGKMGQRLNEDSPQVNLCATLRGY